MARARRSTWVTRRAAALAKPKRMKATCCACRKGIWNRMIYRTVDGKTEYAHMGCVSGEQIGWERGW